MKIKIPQLVLGFLLLGSGVITFNHFSGEDLPEPELVPQYEVDFSRGDQRIGVIDGFVFLNGERLSKEESKPILALIDWGIDNNKRFVAVDSSGNLVAYQTRAQAENTRSLLIHKTYSPIPGSDSLRLNYGLISADSIKNYFSEFDDRAQGWVLTAPKAQSLKFKIQNND